MFIMKPPHQTLRGVRHELAEGLRGCEEIPSRRSLSPPVGGQACRKDWRRCLSLSKAPPLSSKNHRLSG